ncbi:MAG TPA: F-box protein [Waddliaceae bacterium]
MANISGSNDTMSVVLLSEVCCVILSHLDVTGLLVAQKVCTVWYRIANDEGIWKCIAWQKKIFVTAEGTTGLTIKAQVMKSFIPYWRAACMLFPAVQDETLEGQHPACIQRTIDQKIHEANWEPDRAQKELLSYFYEDNSEFDEDNSAIDFWELGSVEQIGRIQVCLELGAKINEQIFLDFMRLVEQPFPNDLNETCAYLAQFITTPSVALVDEVVWLNIGEVDVIKQLNFPDFLRGLIKKMDLLSFQTLIDEVESGIQNNFEEELAELDIDIMDNHMLQKLSERVITHLLDIRNTTQE